MRAHPKWNKGTYGLLLGLAVLVGGLSLAGLTGQGAELLTVCPEGPPSCTFTSIQEAVAAAPDGAAVVVEAGEYAGPVIISKSLTLLGAGTNLVSIIRGVVVVGPFQVTIKGVTLTQGLHGLQAQSPPGLPPQLSPLVVLENVTIAGNAANGITLFNAARAVLRDVLIMQNGISILGNPVGGGIALRGQSSISIGGRTIIRENGANGISLLDEASAQLGPRTLIMRNGLSGIQLGGESQASIDGITSRENGCYGVDVVDDAQAEISGGRLEQNAKAGLHVGGPSSTLLGCGTNTDAAVRATASVSGTIIAGNPIGILVGDLSKDMESATLNILRVTFLQNGCDLFVDSVAEKDVSVTGTIYTSCS